MLECGWPSAAIVVKLVCYVWWLTHESWKFPVSERGCPPAWGEHSCAGVTLAGVKQNYIEPTKLSPPGQAAMTLHRPPGPGVPQPFPLKGCFPPSALLLPAPHLPFSSLLLLPCYFLFLSTLPFALPQWSCTSFSVVHWDKRWHVFFLDQMIFSGNQQPKEKGLLLLLLQPKT